MPRLSLELDVELYRLLQQAAHSNQLSLEEECLCAGAGRSALSALAAGYARWMGGAGMPRLSLELDVELYRLLQQAAHSNQLSLEEECL
ncbi:hypothetical protein CQA16_25375, partial [Enterobacter hormaechei]